MEKGTEEKKSPKAATKELKKWAGEEIYRCFNNRRKGKGRSYRII
jgi:hypothetical protein